MAGTVGGVGWSFLTNHARALVCIAQDPGMRLRDIAVELDVTERSVFGIVNDLAAAGYLIKTKDGRRNCYQIQADLPLGERIGRESTLGEFLGLLVEEAQRARPPGTGRRRARYPR